MIAVPTLPNIRLVIDFDRPTTDDPDGYISMTAVDRETGLSEDAADGPHDEQTIRAVVADLHSYFATGHKSGATKWAEQVNNQDHGNENDGQHR